METQYSPGRRGERVIAAGRIVLAATSLTAVWLDPSEPAKYAHIAYALLWVYLGYAAVVVAGAWRPEFPIERFRLATHLLDLSFFCAFAYFTAGPSSPFFAYFVFSLVCATLRWAWRGTLWTAVGAVTAYVAVGTYFGGVLQDPTFELHTFIIRGGYLSVVAVLLAYLGRYEEQTGREISLLAAWPQDIPDDLDTLLRTDLAHAARILRAPRILLAWSEDEEPWLGLASWGPDELHHSREAPGQLEPLVAEPLAEESFVCADPWAAAPAVLRRQPIRLDRWPEGPIHPLLRDRYEMRTILSCPLHAETFSGRVFFLDRTDLTLDELVLGEIVSGVLAVRIDHTRLLGELRRSAADEERLRLARDLHDGTLQSLTGIALRLAAVRRQLDEGSTGVATRLEEVQHLIATEQRDLRFFIDELRPQQRAGTEQKSLTTRLAELAQRVEREWSLDVDLRVSDGSDEVSDLVTRHVYHMVREALVNAVRHGEATHVDVRVDVPAGGRLCIDVADNGRGFPVHGRFAHAELERLAFGPKNLRERVASLAGQLELESTPAGVRLHIELPGKAA